jgi:hypothetical protein
MSKIAPYILDTEYRCPHCHALPPDIVSKRFVYDIFFAKFKELREEWGKPIPISSGYRCKDHNLAIEGKTVSAHLFGLALDLSFDTPKAVTDFASLVELIHPDLRMGVYTQAYTFVHIDAAWLIEPRATLDWSHGARWSG